MNLLPDSYTPRYLGVTLGRTLSYKAHLEKSDAKQKKKEKKKVLFKNSVAPSGAPPPMSCKVANLCSVTDIYSAAEYWIVSIQDYLLSK